MINSEVTDDFISASLSRSNGDANSDSTFQNNSDINASNTAVIVSEGTITLTNGANQTQDLASLNRDTSNLNETVNRTPDLQNLLNDQSRLMAAATAAGEAVARDIGTYADKKREAALKMADATTDPELKAQYQKEADDWKEGGDYRAAMHAAGGAIIAGLGGGNALGGALGAGLTSKLGGTLNELSENIQKARPTGNTDIDQALAQIVATGVGTAVGAAVGGGSGAFAGYNVDRFNRQLHPDERTWAKDNAKSFAEFYERTTGKAISQGQAENMLLANGYRLVDEIASKGPGGDPVAIAYINQVATGLFQTTSEEFRKPLMNGNRDGSPTPEQLALPAARGNPALGLTVVAGVLTAGVAPEIAAGVVAASRVCATNIVLCMNQIGIGSGELFASSAMPAGTGAAVAMAAKINNFYRDGAAPELLQQAYRQAAVSSTHNAASSEVVLGKYIAGSESSYEAVAASRGSTYFSMSDWNAVQGQMGADKMWNINRAFLDQQMAQGKNFVFTLDPRSVSELSYTAKEYDYLQRNGYVLQEGTGGLFHAIKK
ncbi:hypothetical protein LV28_25050 [Pandoraea pnomenusa]|uniref:Uncharacterized protein n=1 Tax=Pandoraea pnomenusa TaxID=93220 RepID=A0A378YHQ4_9BURK|nr:hypothetical protein [Pandoraea pnomenusa]ALR35853.1 hypothetical protein LV28_25050 [Pandoraea pnomenusa]SUA76070.1 Uncharacterised protein [Pandoraea pnomenusa]